jgi:hypothetical protein
MTRTDEKGVALVFTLFLMAALSAMAVSIMFLAQTETSASRNYKTMSQARYAGEAGVHRVIHYLSSTAYTSLVTSISGFDTTRSPVQYGGVDVVLKPVASASIHPSTTIKNAYAALFTNASLSVGNGATVTYSATATLLSMRLVTVYGGSPQVIQTWRINATGTVPGALPATVEVAAILERDSVPAETYAIFATGNGCGAITMTGNATTDSFDYSAYSAANSGNPTPPPPTTDGHSGSVGTNGNLTIGGQVNVHGNLDTPRTGVGNCTNGNITALSETGGAEVTGDRIQLPQAKTYPTPDTPVPVPTTGSLTITSSSSCLSLTVYLPAFASCSGSAGNFTITTNGQTVTWPNVSVGSGVSLSFNAGIGFSSAKVNVNSFAMDSGSSLNIANGTSLTMNAMGASLGTNTPVIDMTAGSLVNGTGVNAYDASKFQILYSGTATIKIGGSTDTAATVYAPNARVEMGGSANFYGSILSKTFYDNGGSSVTYDRSLASKFFTLGQHVMSSFSWQKY